MTTAVKTVSIQTLVEGLRQLLTRLWAVEPVRRFLQETPWMLSPLALT